MAPTYNFTTNSFKVMILTEFYLDFNRIRRCNVGMANPWGSAFLLVDLTLVMD